ncbi:MAG TPA: TldD/PmbA family protein [Candidatus Limnocylindrales bacterium]|nr:TldD/PmbA family protein [Candidatus Limnocylindrales bacterium]
MDRDRLLPDLVAAAVAGGASYADARFVEREHESVNVKDGAVESIDRTSDRGMGVRVLKGGAWGFAATDRLGDEPALRAVVAEAIARANAAAPTRRHAVALVPQAPQRGDYRTPLRRDPFSVPFSERVALLREADAAMAGGNVRVRRAAIAAYRTRKRLVTSEGTDVRQEIVESAAGVDVLAVKAGAKPARRYELRNAKQAGWEFVEASDLVGRARRYRADAEATLDAPLAAPRATTVILDQPFLALLVHESCGHPTESDRVLEHEVAFAGTTFLWPADRGSLRYGSPHVSMTADATLPGGMGTFGWDDDGVPAARTPLIERGVFTGYLSSRETAGALGLPRSGGSARAEGWQHAPIVRMVNVSLEPGGIPYADLLRGVDDGLLLESPASYSLDDRRQNFHFSAQVARVIRRGEVQGYLRGVAFQSLTPDFWGRCDGVADDWELHGFLSCAKGEPLQLMRVGHGAAHARFRDLPIGAAE